MRTREVCKVFSVFVLSFTFIFPHHFLPSSFAVDLLTVQCSAGGSFSFPGNVINTTYVPNDDDPNDFPNQRVEDRNCRGIATVPEGVVELGSFSFVDQQITSIQFPSTLTTINVGAFMNSGLTSIDIPSNVSVIGGQAFQGSTNLRNILIAGNPDTPTAVSNNTFGGTSLDSLTLGQGNGVVTILSNTLGDLVRVSTLTLGEGLTFDSSTTSLFIRLEADGGPIVGLFRNYSRASLAGTGFDSLLPRPQASSEEAARAAAAVAAAKREAEVKAARSDISSKLAKSEMLTVDSFKQADIAGVTADNFTQVQAEILALPVEASSDLKQVLMVARKYEVVGKIASENIRSLPNSAFVEVGLIPAASKNKASLIAAVRRVEPSDRDSYAEIQTIIATEAASINARKDRLAAVIASIKNRFKG